MGVTTSWRRPIMHLIPSGTEVHICFLLHSTTYFKQRRTSSYWDLDEHIAWEMNYIVEYQQDKITVKSEQSVWVTCSKPNTSTSSRGWERETATLSLYVWTQGEAMFRLTIPVHRKWIFPICFNEMTALMKHKHLQNIKDFLFWHITIAGIVEHSLWCKWMHTTSLMTCSWARPSKYRSTGQLLLTSCSTVCHWLSWLFLTFFTLLKSQG